MQTWEAITSRRNVRSFADRPIPAEDLDRILEAVGSSHAGVADLRLARELLGFPEDRDWVLLISLGYPAGRPVAGAGPPPQQARLR